MNSDHQGCKAIPRLGVRPTQVSNLTLMPILESNQALTPDMIIVQVAVLCYEY